MSDDSPSETREAPIDDAVVHRAADETGVDPDELADALVEFNAALLGQHSKFEREGDHVTVDDVRAYRVPRAAWDDVVADFSFDDDVEEAVHRAHAEQARLAFASTADADEGFANDEAGVVIGVDTAEQF
ncbi:hypothetical protein NDI76_04220 [Halogeometricum sp. S1BR25-6]|uniref:DUF8048 domain-containing protein n=1 Tax=Halogeometricum salsisoli TaxID=2950536 RepID=A0ABU2GCQ5_9EURY|nr:hypothetical protein [Halogeometricum sp. S1BR25-6]MDS0297939.1 hypothetical protein [Halogeometricum sp. S1BR25-6]